MLHHLPDNLKAKGFLEIRRVLKPGGCFMAVDFAAHSHSPLGHLLSIFGHSRGESMVDKLIPMLKDAGFSDVEGIPTRTRTSPSSAPAEQCPRSPSILFSLPPVSQKIALFFPPLPSKGHVLRTAAVYTI
jgi:SAM-dependent methyltransferase